MRRERIVDLHLYTGSAIDCVRFARSVHQGDAKIAHLRDPARNRPARRLHVRRDVCIVRRPDPVALQLLWRAELARNVRKCFCRVARHAMALHIDFPFCRIPNQDVQHLVGAAIRHILHLQVQEFGNVRQLLVRHGCECRHAFFRAAFLEEWRKVLSMIVCEYHVRRDQAWPRRSASCLSVAKCAVLHEQRHSARRCSFVRHGPKPKKCACCGCTLRCGHILITLLRTLLARLGLLAGGNNSDKRDAPHEHCGPHQVAHCASLP